MTARSLLLAAVGLAMLLCVSGEAILEIVEPPSLVTHFGGPVTPIREALFGVPPYGESITSRVLHSDGNPTACDVLTREQIPDIGEEPFILLVLRGNCTFVTKVRHAEMVGAEAVIIRDNRDEPRLPYMADDGTAGDVHIPSIMVNHEDGDSILAASGVTAQMTFTIEESDNVRIDFWTNSWDTITEEFKEEFGDVVRALGKDITVHPQLLVLDGSHWGCDTPAHICGEQCTNGGRYCAVDPEHHLGTGVSGANVIEENLRQQCLATVLSTSNQALWFNYTAQFNKECKDQWTSQCSYGQMANLGIDTTQVQQCVTSSGGTTADAENSILKQQLGLIVQQGIQLIPTILINGEAYRGGYSCPKPHDAYSCAILRVVCAGFTDGNEPAACFDSGGCPLGQLRDECGVCGGNGAFDQCGFCLRKNSSVFGKLCVDCAGVVGGSHTRDVCGVCGGSATTIAGCYSGTTDGSSRADQKCDCEGVSIATVVGVTLLFSVVITGAVSFLLWRQIQSLKRSMGVDGILSSYPLNPGGSDSVNPLISDLQPMSQGGNAGDSEYNALENQPEY